MDDCKGGRKRGPLEWEQSELKALKRPKGSDESLGFKHKV